MRFESLVGDWSALCARLDRTQALARWSRTEPSLATLSSVDDLAIVTNQDQDRPSADNFIGALIRVAAIDGGDDSDAATVVLHLLRPGLCRLAQRLRHRGPEVLALIVGEAACVIRAYPWQRRTRAYAAGILLDVKHNLWYGELAPLGDATKPAAAVLFNPADLTRKQANQCTETPEVELVDLLLWAARSGAISVEDAQLLLDCELGRCYGAGTRAAVAMAAGMSDRTFHRRRQRTIAALVRVAPEYQQAVA